MPFGTGKYDDIAALVRETTQAEVAVVLVGGGNRGDGFSVQLLTSDTNGALRKLAKALRDTAELIEADCNEREA
jgi:hypothetical protein